MLPRPAAAILSALVLLLAASAALAGPGADFTRRYSMQLMGAPAGFMTTSQRTADDTITTTSSTNMKIARGNATLEISFNSVFIETLAGKPVSMTTTQTFGAAPATEVYQFTADAVTRTRDQGGSRITETLPLPPGDWLTPAAAARAADARFAAGEKSVTVSTIDGTMGFQVVTFTRRIIGPEKITLHGRTVDAIRTEVESSVMPGMPSSEWLDDAGAMLASETSIGGLRVRLERLDDDQPAPDAAAPAPEMMVSTFITPSRPIPRPRQVTSAAYVLRVPEGALPELPTTGSQIIERLDERSARVIITAATPSPAPAGDAQNASYLASSPAVAADDTMIVQFAALALRSAGLTADAPADKRAEALRRSVFSHITSKDLGVGFGTASEVIRSRSGDCTEHAVLLAAALRAQGIPARIASGLIYADQFAGERQIFGYHMWTQALLTIDGSPRWVDLDATLPARPFDATHITLAVSSMADGSFQSTMLPVASLLGRLKIDVERAE